MKSSWRVQSAMAHMHRRAGPGRAWLSAGLVPGWAALAAKAGRRFRKAPKAPRSATPAMLYRPLPISARCGSPSLYWPGAGVRHGPCMHNGHRTGPQAVVGHRRLLGKPCCIPQILQGPPTRQQCSPDGRNLKIHTFHSNRVLKIAFFVPNYTQRPPSSSIFPLFRRRVSQGRRQYVLTHQCYLGDRETMKVKGYKKTKSQSQHPNIKHFSQPLGFTTRQVQGLSRHPLGGFR